MEDLKKILFDCRGGWHLNSRDSACQAVTGRHIESTVRDYIWSSQPNGIVRLCQWHIDNAFDLGWTSDNMQLTCHNTSHKSAMAIELPCHNCYKMNDVGARRCWWCTCLNPN